ncbi:Interleukin-1 receptor-associated kinase 1 [Halocaridina rubra]|uniref:Interleukin-1 receptor-associated kinase 1 n=1 Tax=Halocaridina rubra TaxID=373956 RepID=A0AAN8WW46_HALRR
MGDDNENSFFYVYDLPYTERMDLCGILDTNNAWEELGGKYMGFSLEDRNKFRRAEYSDRSPSDRMLQEWGQKNHTVIELFEYLFDMKHFQAMRAIKKCVPEKYHILFDMRKQYKSLLEVFQNIKATNVSQGALGGVNAGSKSSLSLPYQDPNRFQQQQQQYSEGNSISEGATALVSPAMKYGHENLNDVTTSACRQLSPSKVPEIFLNPATSNVLHNHQYMKDRCSGKSNFQSERKIINNEICG